MKDPVFSCSILDVRFCCW